jgi:predicted RNA-binding Zn ribbon-like protein
MSETLMPVLSSPAFDFSGNRLCLDFANTLTDRASEVPQEHLAGYSDLVAWGVQAGIVRDEEAQCLLEAAELHATEAEAARQRAVALREALYRLFSAVVEGVAPTGEDLSVVNASLADAMSRTQIVPERGGFSWCWGAEDTALDRIEWSVVRDAANLLTSETLDSVRKCAAEDCNWLFLDTSKNHSRRWCAMKSCGNRAKVRKHYQHKKQSALEV